MNSTNLIIRNILHTETYPIRREVLWPNSPPSFVVLEGDREALHFGGFLGDQLVCVCSIFIENNSAQLRKFATLQQFQCQGIGTQLMSHIFNQLLILKVSNIWCNAREDALSFYRNFSMKECGNCFYKHGIAYRKMSIDYG
ncbi:GNAT family N-acetyltransferase [Halioxenophilus aromaticivorans]|jgi:predicted GNAT family N-acyltransferase|uniref:GNAT family N-acetyltransferase n=1 Tax=Halioxenophilus aromaticivorans TaxID=1306992 RepID=A0AAV3U6L8_9ALTE|tara:strand:- start:2015 stop:2437 length:423 start_codon:yes stop_codon:yes gene_type:complete